MDMQGHHLWNLDEALRNGKNSRASLAKLGVHLEQLQTYAECHYCGGFVDLNLSPDDQLTLVEGQEPCVFPEPVPVTTTFVCRSGKVALGNDFRQYFPLLDSRQKQPKTKISGLLKRIWTIQQAAEQGYVTGPVGNTGVFFVRTEAGLDVVEPWYDDEGYDRLDEESLHHVSTELWWYALLDAEDLPKGATDSYDRPLVVVDLEPGTYEVTYHFELYPMYAASLWKPDPPEHPHTITWGSLKKTT